MMKVQRLQLLPPRPLGLRRACAVAWCATGTARPSHRLDERVWCRRECAGDAPKGTLKTAVLPVHHLSGNAFGLEVVRTSVADRRDVFGPSIAPRLRSVTVSVQTSAVDLA